MDAVTRKAWGPRILAARVAAGLNQDDVAEQASTNRKTLGNIETGRTTGQTKILENLIAVLGLNDELEWDENVRILAPAFLTLIQHIPSEVRPLGVSRAIGVLVALIKEPDQLEGLVDEEGDIID